MGLRIKKQIFLRIACGFSSGHCRRRARGSQAAGSFSRKRQKIRAVVVLKGRKC